MTHAVGIEGSWPEDSVVTWGAVAMKDQDGLFNSVTRIREHPAHNAEYAKFDRPIKIPDEADHASHLIAAGVRKHHPFSHLFRIVPDKTPGMVASVNFGSSFVYIFRDRTSFDSYALKVASRVTVEVLFSSTGGDEVALRNLVRGALAIAPRSPFLHLSNVHLAKRKSRAHILAEGLLSSEDKAVFRHLYTALTTDDLMYEIKYEHGIAELGGLGISDFADLLKAASNVQKTLREELVIPKYPVLGNMSADLPPLRAVGLENQSATLKFAVSIKDESPLIRIARYLEVLQLQEILRGEVPESLAQNPEFMTELSRVVAPDEDTTCTHRPVGQGEFEPTRLFEEDEPEEEASVQREISVLGFVQGIMRNSQYIEVRLSPKERLNLSIRDDGTGALPLGIGIFTEGKSAFLYKPFRLRVSVQGAERPKVYLREIEAIDSKGESFAISALPSSVERRSFFVLDSQTGVPLELSRHGRGVRLGDETAMFGKSLDDIKVWFDAFQLWCSHVEMQHFDAVGAEWVIFKTPSSKPSVPTRIMIALSEIEKRATVSNVTEFIYKRWHSETRKTNARKTIRKKLQGLAQLDASSDTVSLTEQGVRWCHIYERVHGDRKHGQ